MRSPTNGSDGVECSALQNYKGYIGFVEGLTNGEIFWVFVRVV